MTAMALTYDCIHHWSGGTETGRWVTVPASPDDLAALLVDYRVKGFIAKPGRISIGPPDTAPSASDWAKLEKP